MIKVQDWVASIPDEDKHVAYVGEGMSETREFWLGGEGWETYRNWSFHLDMAFDPESITTRESRQVVQTHSSSSKAKGETTEDIEESMTKETYTVENEEVLNYHLTDIASLEKRVREDGIYLTWTVLRQHTVLPGKLWATLRAEDGTAMRVKKSAIMVFEVDAAVGAIHADAPPISELEQIEARVALAADNVTYDADRAERAVTQIQGNLYVCQAHAEAAQQAGERASEYATCAEEAYASALNSASSAAQHKQEAQACVTQVEEYCEQAADSADAAAKAQASAAQAAASASLSAGGAARAAEQCAGYADGMAAAARTLENAAYRRVNVRDYGAVGDGATDDQPAIWAAWQAAKALVLQDIPCELYFPAGTYGFLNGGMRFALPSGKGGLRITGAGRETTIIQYLADWQPSSPYGGSHWYAIDVCPESNGVTGDYDTYIHDVAITGLTVYDPDPCSHAWHPDKGDSGKEENHGVNIGHCLRASVTECQFITVGDEAIDIYSCSDVVVMNNHLVGCPGAGSAGGAIAICDGCNGVVVSNNTVNGSALDETLDNGKVIGKMNFGIAVESLGIPVRNVVIANNVVRNIQGNGINLGATGADSGMYNISVEGNIIQGCNNGVSDEGAYPKVGVTINNNIITDCTKLRDGSGYGIFLEAPGFTAVSIRGNTIRNTDVCGAYVHGVDSLVEGNVFENIGAEAVYIIKSAAIRACTIKNTGLSETKGNGAISCYGNAVYRVCGCKLTGVRQTKGIMGATEISDTIIEMVDADGNRVTKEMCVDSDRLKRLLNCQMDGYIIIKQNNALVQGVTLNCGQQWQPAVMVSANGVMITGCNITAMSGRDAIAEQSGYNHNLFANNIVNRPITTVGAQSVSVNNVDTRVTA